MMETWLDGKGWKKIKKKIPNEYRWKVQLATRQSERERARGDMLLGIKREIQEEIERKKVEAEEGKIECKIKIENDSWRIVGLYVNKDLDRKLMEEKYEEINTLIGKDFNARTGEKEGTEEEEKTGEGNKKDRRIRK